MMRKLLITLVIATFSVTSFANDADLERELVIQQQHVEEVIDQNVEKGLEKHQEKIEEKLEKEIEENLDKMMENARR